MSVLSGTQIKCQSGIISKQCATQQLPKRLDAISWPTAVRPSVRMGPVPQTLTFWLPSLVTCPTTAGKLKQCLKATVGPYSLEQGATNHKLSEHLSQGAIRGHGPMPSPGPETTWTIILERTGPVSHDQDQNCIVPPESKTEAPLKDHGTDFPNERKADAAHAWQIRPARSPWQHPGV